MNKDQINKEILRFIQGDIPVTANPFANLANSLNMTEEEVVDYIKSLQTTGIVRRMGAVLRHQKAGYNANAMVAWRVEEEVADKIGEVMATHSHISHCYLRIVPEEFGFNLFTMIHAQNKEQLNAIIEQVSLTTNLKDYAILNSIRELKKVSMQYI